MQKSELSENSTEGKPKFPWRYADDAQPHLKNNSEQHESINAEKKKEETQAQRLLKFAEALPLFHDQNKQPFTILNGETCQLSSNKIKDYLSFYG